MDRRVCRRGVGRRLDRAHQEPPAGRSRPAAGGDSRPSTTGRRLSRSAGGSRSSTKRSVVELRGGRLVDAEQPVGRRIAADRRLRRRRAAAPAASAAATRRLRSANRNTGVGSAFSSVSSVLRSSRSASSSSRCRAVPICPAKRPSRSVRTPACSSNGSRLPSAARWKTRRRSSTACDSTALRSSRAAAPSAPKRSQSRASPPPAPSPCPAPGGAAGAAASGGAPHRCATARHRRADRPSRRRPGGPRRPPLRPTAGAPACSRPPSRRRPCRWPAARAAAAAGRGAALPPQRERGDRQRQGHSAGEHGHRFGQPGGRMPGYAAPPLRVRRFGRHQGQGRHAEIVEVAPAMGFLPVFLGFLARRDARISHTRI